MNSKRILVVDDQEQNVFSLKMRLEKVGYAVLEAYGGFEALNIATKEFPDLILLDIMMPQINGFEVCRKLSEDATTKHIPIILVTAVPKREYVKKSFEVGAFDYISKPFNFEELLHRVNSALKLSESERLIKELSSAVEFLETLQNENSIVRRSLEKSKNLISEILHLCSAEPIPKDVSQKIKQLSKELSAIEKQLNASSLHSIPAVLSKLKNFGQKGTIN